SIGMFSRGTLYEPLPLEGTEFAEYIEVLDVNCVILSPMVFVMNSTVFSFDSLSKCRSMLDVDLVQMTNIFRRD
ncbi:1586_t:CDS:1, partial [Dentiscutata erythropus]